MSSTTTQVSQGIRNALGMWVATARALQPKAVTRTVRVTTNEGKNTMANAIRKRIALAAAVAVSAGLLSAVPAQAAGTGNELPFFVSTAELAVNSDGTTLNTISDTDSSVSVVHNASNAGNFIELTSHNATLSSYTGGYRVDVTGSTIVSSTRSGSAAGTINTARTSVTYTTIETSTVVRVSTGATGSISIKVTGLTAASGVVTETALQTFSVTVNAAKTAGIATAANSTVYFDTQTASPAPSKDSASAIGDNTGAAGASNTLAFYVVLKDANKRNVTDTITATITSGPGLLKVGAGTAAKAVQSLNANAHEIDLVSDGTNVGGTTVVSFTVGTTTIATKTVKMFGKAATLEAKALKVVENADSTSAVLWVVAKDAQGNIVPSQPVTVTSKTTSLVSSTTGTSATAAQAADAVATINLVSPAGATFGKATLEISVTADATVKTSVDVQVSEATADAATITFDKASYAPGEQVTMSVSLVDDNGAPLANNFTATNAVSSVSVNLATPSLAVGDINTALGKLDNGKATVKFFAPATPGDVAVTLTFGSTDFSSKLATKTATGSFKVAAAGSADITQIKTDLAKLQKDTMDLIAALSAQVSYLRKQLNQLLRRR